MYWITGALGLGFGMAPFALEYADNPVALWTSLLLGGGVMMTSYLEAVADGKDRWEYWVAILAGAGAMVAPFALGFRDSISAMWTSIGIGVLLAIVAGYKLLSDQPRYG